MNNGRVYKAARPPGTTAVVAFSGYVQSGEAHGDLSGQQKWTTYSNAMAQVPVVATGIRYFANLLAGTEWHAEEPKEASAKDRVRAMEIIDQGLLNSPMLKPWGSVIRKAALYKILGFSLHATGMRRRKDGLIVYSAIEHRPQHSIERWLRDAETEPFHACVQRGKQTGKEYTLPLDEALYCVDDTLTDGPEGVGMLRHVIEYVRRLGLFEEWEGEAYAEDLAGIPYARAPLGELAGAGTAAEQRTNVLTGTEALRDFMTDRYKSEDTTRWLMLDSSNYDAPDGSPGSMPKWTFERIKTETANLDRLDATIRRVELQIARVLGIEFALMGADGKGSYAQHEDKTSMFATNLQTTLTELGWFATNQLARRLIARNGLDPDTCTPKLVAEPISTEAILVVTQSLANLSAAGLMPDDPALPVLYKRMRLPFKERTGFDPAPRAGGFGRFNRPGPAAEVPEQEAEGDGAPDESAPSEEAASE